MKHTRPNLAFAASTLLATLALARVARAEEPVPAARSSASLAAEPPVATARDSKSADEPTWEERQSSRETRRDVGIGLTIPGLVLGAGGAALIAKGLGGSGGGSFQIIGEEVPGGMLLGVGTLLLAVGVPLWIANSGEEPRPPTVRAELGIGPGSFELRGSF